MNLTGNTIFITGGGSGIGRGLAEALHAKGNKVIIAGRRKDVLAAVTAANPGIHSIELDIADPASIASVAQTLIQKYPDLNVVLNNAGIMKFDDASAAMDDAQAADTITTNLLGPIRLTAALVDHLKQQPTAAIIHMTSGLAFTPLANAAVYSATKAALHSYTLSQRFQLRGTNVRVLEIAPPYVQTELGGAAQAADPRAMPLQEFIEETIRVLGTDADEVLTERVKPLRNNAGPNEWAFVEQFNTMMTGGH
jgi:uncharacterized oxidoreductase